MEVSDSNLKQQLCTIFWPQSNDMKTQKQLQASFSDLEEKPDKVFPETREIIYLSNHGSRLNLVLFSWKKTLYFMLHHHWKQEAEVRNQNLRVSTIPSTFCIRALLSVLLLRR